MSAALASQKQLWMTSRDATAALGICRDTLPRVVAAARITTKTLPGVMGTRYLRSDVLKVASECVIVGSSGQAAAGGKAPELGPMKPNRRGRNGRTPKQATKKGTARTR